MQANDLLDSPGWVSVPLVMTVCVYLGPEGTFSHLAAQILAPEGAQLQACDTLEAVLNALLAKEADYAVAAMMSAAGPIAETEAALKSGVVERLSEHGLPVSFDLYRRRDDTSALKGVYAHPKALAQISDWLSAHGCEGEAVQSNTAGLARLNEAPRKGWAAAGPPNLAEHYNLDVVARQLEGEQPNTTLFVLLRRAPGAVAS